VPVTPATVKALSLTGMFDALPDAAILPFITEAAEHYVGLPQRPTRQSVVDLLIALHAAHRLYQAMKQESGGENGGGEGQTGPVKSAMLVRVGAWTFGGGASEQIAGGDKVPIPDWDESPFGKRWRGLWAGVPLAASTTRLPLG
jgi:hypothetical protein